MTAASAASADACGFPACLLFHNVVLNTKALGGVAVVKPSGSPLKVSVSETQVSGSTVDYDITGWTFPTYSLSKPAPGTISVNPNTTDPEGGTLNTATGAATMSVDLLATISITGVGDCTVDAGQLRLTTASTEPLQAMSFGSSAGLASGDGAIGAGWSTLQPGTGPACTLVAGDLTGAGGIWMAGSITPPNVKVTASKIETVKAGKKATVKIKLANSGKDSSGVLKVCLAAPKNVKPKSSCKTIKNVAGGKSSTVSFKVKATKKKAKKYSLKLTVTPKATGLLAAGGKPFSKKLTLKVKK